MTLDLAALERHLAPRLAVASQRQVARALGLEPSVLSRWRNGAGATYPVVAQVAARLGVDPATLWLGPVPKRFTAHVPDGVIALDATAAGADRAHAYVELSVIATMAAELAQRAQAAADRLKRSVTGATAPAGVAAGLLPGEAEESPEPAQTPEPARRTPRARRGR